MCGGCAVRESDIVRGYLMSSGLKYFSKLWVPTKEGTYSI
jgi:hypothetical protein